MPKINKSSPSTGEAIMICIDTSDWMENKESPRFKQQADAIRFYYNYGNCNLVHVQPNSTVLAALFSSQIIQSGSRGSASQESYSVAALSLSRSLITPHVGASRHLSVQQESYSVAALALSRFAIRSQSSLDLKLDNANPNWQPVTLDQKFEWSQSSLDLELDNANPNWQPETLDQKIERVKRELQSLIQQKNQQVAC
ncbi:hypothetical protein Tco_0371073 [Tanacetum coccineum]